VKTRHIVHWSAIMRGSNHIGVRHLAQQLMRAARKPRTKLFQWSL
jgi:hypothetical protein